MFIYVCMSARTANSNCFGVLTGLLVVMILSRGFRGNNSRNHISNPARESAPHVMIPAGTGVITGTRWLDYINTLTPMTTLVIS
jgi:hypothetical protein